MPGADPAGAPCARTSQYVQAGRQPPAMWTGEEGARKASVDGHRDREYCAAGGALRDSRQKSGQEVGQPRARRGDLVAGLARTKRPSQCGTATTDPCGSADASAFMGSSPGSWWYSDVRLRIAPMPACM